jgi:hypothetical protein
MIVIPTSSLLASAIPMPLLSAMSESLQACSSGSYVSIPFAYTSLSLPVRAVISVPHWVLVAMHVTVAASQPSSSQTSHYPRPRRITPPFSHPPPEPDFTSPHRHWLHMRPSSNPRCHFDIFLASVEGYVWLPTMRFLACGDTKNRCLDVHGKKISCIARTLKHLNSCIRGALDSAVSSNAASSRARWSQNESR